MKMRTYTAALAAMLTLCAVAAPVTEDTARTAANAFVTTDAIGSAILGGRTVGNIQSRGELWIVALDPAGHIILSASDLAKPVIGFSEDNFTEPDPDSPAFALLEGNSERIRRLEESATDSSTPDPQWTSLLTPTPTQRSKKLLGAEAVTDQAELGTIIIPPLLQFPETVFDQCQPYNDFSPVYNSSTNDTYKHPSYRGRCPCGCVATAAAIAAQYFRWPARIDKTISYNHDFIDTNNVLNAFPIRFDGNTPIDWNGVDGALNNPTVVTNITEWLPNGQYYFYEWNGYFNESDRFPVARLILLMDVLSNMSFKWNSSSANYETVAQNMSDWYTMGERFDLASNTQSIIDHLSAGIPCQLSLGGSIYAGHAAVIDGWAEQRNSATSSYSSQYAHINCGWGDNPSTGWYDVIDSFTLNNGSSGIDYPEKKVYLNHYPRAKPQLDPLPTVCSNNLTLSWHFPDIHTNHLSGFFVTKQKMKTETSFFLDNFSNSAGVASDPASIYVSTNEEYNIDGYLLYANDGNLLYAKSQASGHWTFPGTYTLTAASVLTFKLLSFAALGMTCEIQAKPINGEWQTICTPTLKTDWGSSGWSTERIYLGDRGGESVNLRIAYSYDNGSYYSKGRILIDDFKITDVLAPEALTTENVKYVGGNVRNHEFTGLDNGTTYVFTVKPNFSLTPTIAGVDVVPETSEPLTVVIKGNRIKPKPGLESTSYTNIIFSTYDTSGIWSYQGNVKEQNAIGGSYGSISAKIPGLLSEDSFVLFDWLADREYYEDDNSYDVISVILTDLDGNKYNLLSRTNRTQRTETVNEIIPLNSYVDETGNILISYQRFGLWYGRGGAIYAPTIGNLLVPTVPEVSWTPETLTALGEPEIRSVKVQDDDDEIFYKECTTNKTTLIVECSENVTNLFAHSSHPSLVSSDDIVVSKYDNSSTTEQGSATGGSASGSATGGSAGSATSGSAGSATSGSTAGSSTGSSTAGTAPSSPVRFKVCITPSGVNETNYRSRMILTLEAVDANGTKTYKDLSLRFEKVEEEIPEEHPTTVPIQINVEDQTTPSGSRQINIDLPITWLEENGLAASDATAEDLNEAANADADGDGISNWQEYVCGTDPTNSEEKITCTISFDDEGNVIVESSLDGKDIANGFRAVTKESDDLKTWSAVQTTGPTKQFFKVVIEQVSGTAE